MKSALRGYGVLVAALLFYQARPLAGHAQTGTPAAGSSIRVLALNQPPCSVPSAKSVIVAKVAYHIAEGQQSDHGFAVSIKFQGKDPRMTFSTTRLGQVAVTTAHDTLTIEYPMEAIWHDARLQRPLVCYFFLHRNTGPGRSVVIAKTKPITFQECQ